MSEHHVYRVIELAGSSTSSIEDAIQTAVGQVSGSIRNLRWCEVQSIRGHIEDGRVAHFQVVLKVGFTLDQESA